MDSSTLFIAGSLALVLVVSLFYLFNRTVTRRWQKHRAETIETWEAEGIEFVLGPEGCQFGGLESTGSRKVIRGIGYTVVTSKDLRVTRSAPSEVQHITHKQIKRVQLMDEYLDHQSNTTPFIVVGFKRKGQKDKLGFQVKPYQEWAEKIAQLAGVRLKDSREGE